MKNPRTFYIFCLFLAAGLIWVLWFDGKESKPRSQSSRRELEIGTPGATLRGEEKRELVLDDEGVKKPDGMSDDDWQRALPLPASVNASLGSQMNNNVNGIWGGFRKKLEAVQGLGLLFNEGLSVLLLRTLNSDLPVELHSQHKDLLLLANGSKPEEVVYQDIYLLGNLGIKAMFSEFSSADVHAYSIIGDVDFVKNGLKWRPGWIPFMIGAGGRPIVCVDRDPDVSGNDGQVIEIDLFDNQIRVLASSVYEYLKRMNDSLETDTYLFEDEMLEFPWSYE